MERTGKILFYEDKNFQGRYFECSGDCSELNIYFSRCNSVYVESGAWVLYERPNYLGLQYVLMKGGYSEYRHWMGYSDSVRSCRIVRTTSAGFQLNIYEHPDFDGKMLECTEDVENLPDHWQLHEIHSAQVQGGAWVFYELPHFRGRQYLLERGMYRRYQQWAAINPNVGSLSRVF